jgi:hypothetical protein
MKRVWLLLFLALPACEERATAGLVKRAQFGIFFGGQVQEREQIPFEPSRASQVQGFRLEFTAPLEADLAVEWEINRPRGSQKSARSAPQQSDRLVQLGQARARAGQTRFDQVLPFKPGDPLGVWNIRVLAGGQLAIDRRFLVYDKEERARAERDAGTEVRAE